MFGLTAHKQVTPLGARIFVLLAGVALLAVSGCGTGKTLNVVHARAADEPAYSPEPRTHEQRLVEEGARLVVSDGCSACHLNGHSGTAPSFASFAGQRVTLADGRHVLVEERFLREALSDPRKTQIKGYALAPMLAAVARLHLGGQPKQVAALAAFIEQIGPEPG